MEDYNDMLKMYPQLILMTPSPPTWKGLLTINNNSSNTETKIKVKFTAPLFPKLDNASVKFGGCISHLYGVSFKNQVELLIKRSESVTNFFQELTTLIENLISDNEQKHIPNNLIRTDAIEKLFKELGSILSEFSDVEISSAKDLSAIKLTMNDISMVVQPVINSTGQNTWKIISSDLPKLTSFNITEKKQVSLKDLRNTFQRQVGALEDVYDQLRRIDNYCWVMDPIDPKPYHLYRRIYLSPTLSFLLTINPIDPTGFPSIKFFGPDGEVEKYRNMMQDAFEEWDVEYSVYENLITLLNIDEFPQAPKVKKSEADGMVGDEECCICFSSDLDGGELSDKICNNLRCRRHFHSTCLFQWLQELPTNKILFNQIFGPCPNCGEEVSCSVPSS